MMQHILVLKVIFEIDNVQPNLVAKIRWYDILYKKTDVAL